MTALALFLTFMGICGLGLLALWAWERWDNRRNRP